MQKTLKNKCDHEDEGSDNNNCHVIEVSGPKDKTIKRIMFVTGPINEGLLQKFAPAAAMCDDGVPLEIRLTSHGGSVTVGMAMFSIIERYQGELVVLGVGYISSMAAIIMQAAPTRLLDKHCRFMIHDGSVFMGDNEMGFHRTRSAEVERLNKWCQKQLAARSKWTLKRLREASAKETYMSAAEAVEAGFADAIAPDPTRKRASKRKPKPKTEVETEGE